jgi:membrane-associated PAP2 superfamily phosphatase
MEKYTYDFALDRPFEFVTALTPISGVPVRYRDEELSQANLDVHGRISLELPTSIVAALKRRTAYVCPFFDLVGIDGRLARQLSEVQVRDYS